MRLIGWLGIGVVAALGLGSLMVALPASHSASAEPASVSVPVGRIGDEVEYDLHWQESDRWEDGCEPPAGSQTKICEASGRGVTKYALRVNGTERVTDKNGAQREALVIWRTRTFDDGEYGLPGRLYVNFTPDRSPVRDARFYFDLGSRDPVRTDRFFGNSSNWLHADWEILWNGFAFVRYQGRTFEAGDDLTAGNASTAYRTFDDPGEVKWKTQVFTPLSFHSRVAERAVVDGHDAFAIRSTLHASVVQEYGVEAGGGEVYRWDDSIERVAWISSDLPYPVRTEFHSRRTLVDSEYGKLVHEEISDEILALRAYRAGSSLVSWGTPISSNVTHAATRMLERSSQGFPADGSGSSLEYPVASALANVRKDASLIGFQSWVKANPRHFLAGMGYWSAFSDTSLEFHLALWPRSQIWLFVFGAADDGCYVVASRKNPTTGETRNTDMGRSLDPPCLSAELRRTEAALPGAPITLAEGERIWKQAWGSQAMTDRPLWAVWGYSADWSSSGPWPHTPMDRQTLVWGSSSMGRFLAFGSGNTKNADPESSNQTDVVVDVETGLLVSGDNEQRRWSVLGCGPCNFNALSPQKWLDPPIENAGTPNASPPTQLTTGILAGASLLALVLLAYLFPLLKYAAAQGLGALPGYAKIRKAELLNHSTRDHLLQLIKADPGITPPQLQGHVKAGWSTIVYHLGVLEKNQLVSSLIDGRHKRFFPVGEVDHSKRGQLAALKNERTRQLYEIVLGEPGVIQSELARRVGVALHSTLWHIHRLEAVGLLGHDKQGRKVHYFANPKDTMVDRYDAKAAVEVT